jgi:hypothetical protein
VFLLVVPESAGIPISGEVTLGATIAVVASWQLRGRRG